MGSWPPAVDDDWETVSYDWVTDDTADPEAERFGQQQMAGFMKPPSGGFDRNFGWVWLWTNRTN